MASLDTVFSGSIPQLYEAHLVPLIFEAYAQDLARRARAAAPRRVLEVTAGTGVVTRALAAALPAPATIVATDLNAAMLDHAATLPIARGVEWRTANALELPFADASFDTVVCQFGVMFFPDKARFFAEARRVLAPGGRLLFNVWDRIEDNEFAHVTTEALAERYPHDPPRFLARTPHGWHEQAAIVATLAHAGFTGPRLQTVAERSVAPRAEGPAIGYCQGTPLANEIIEREPDGLAAATAQAAQAIAARFGAGPVDAKMQAIVVEVER
ncbi:MAG TPA: methyltransferase domain-containing protein [Ideonella sp.]|nr:methyltransferase domain-containing protein [Ideonella sp.]